MPSHTQVDERFLVALRAVMSPGDACGFFHVYTCSLGVYIYELFRIHIDFLVYIWAFSYTYAAYIRDVYNTDVNIRPNHSTAGLTQVDERFLEPLHAVMLPGDACELSRIYMWALSAYVYVLCRRYAGSFGIYGLSRICTPSCPEAGV